MRFREFLQNKSQGMKGLFGDPIKVDPVRADHEIDKKFYKPPSASPKGGSTIKRMMRPEKMIASSPRPTGATPKQVTLQSSLGKKPEYFKMPGKPKNVKPPLDLM
jgi:hypothetical protein